LACSIGSAINLSVSNNLLQYGVPWLMSGLVGLAISSVWNYGVTNVTTWRRLKGRS
jgi:putative flippase GtrA